MRSYPGGTTVVLAGMVGGLVVGLADGLVAAVRSGMGAVGLLSSLGLVAAVDVLVGGLLAFALVILLGLARWGRRGGISRLATYVAWGITGLAAGVASAAMVAATATRPNRFLAAGTVVLVALLSGLAGALCSPAVARILRPTPTGAGRRQAELAGAGFAPTAAGLLLCAPLAAAALSVVIFVTVWQTRAPLSPAVRSTCMAVAGLVAGLVPAALVFASTRLRSLNWQAAAAATAALIVLPLLLFVRGNWIRHLQFLPWADARVLAYILLAGGVVVLLWRRRAPRRLTRWAAVLLLPPLLGALVVWLGGIESARKAASSHAGLVGPLLALVRPALDFDRDGYPGLLGGGDCNDENPGINPAAQDWPEDGVDQDCDGHDLRAVDLRPPPLHALPPGMPRDLNILFIVIDTLRADHLGCYGHKRRTSPEIDALAAEGVVFENAWAHAPSTRFSMPAIVTGRWPSAIRWEPPAPGAARWWPAFSRDHRTIAEVLREDGYFNGAFYAYEYFNRGDGRGFERGIDQYDDRLAAKHIDQAGGPAESVGSSAREMADDGIDFLRSYRDEKFFLTLHFYDPHLGYERHPGAPDFGSQPADAYDGEVWYTDRNVGRVIGALRELRLYDRTAIFITGDHGEGFGEHGVLAHGYDLYAPQTKVPLIARVPGLGSRRVKDPVGHVDLAPTFVNLAGGKPEKSFLGRSLIDLLAGRKGAAPPPQYVFQEVNFPPEPPRFPSYTERRALVSATHHLLWNQVPENTVFCFDLTTDPGEKRDLWGTPAGELPCRGLMTELTRKLSLLKLNELPQDFIERVSASVSAPGQPAPAPSQRRRARFGDLVSFVGYDVSILGTPFPSQGPSVALPEGGGDHPGPGHTEVVRIARGGEVELTSYFEVNKDLSGWRIFFHLDGPVATMRNLDHVPVGGAYPVERWRAGQKIRDRFRLRFGPDYPPGLHTLHIGFWRPPSSLNRRLPVAPPDLQDGRDRFRVVSFSVE